MGESCTILNLPGAPHSLVLMYCSVLYSISHPFSPQFEGFHRRRLNGVVRRMRGWSGMGVESSLKTMMSRRRRAAAQLRCGRFDIIAIDLGRLLCATKRNWIKWDLIGFGILLVLKLQCKYFAKEEADSYNGWCCHGFYLH